MGYIIMAYIVMAYDRYALVTLYFHWALTFVVYALVCVAFLGLKVDLIQIV